MNLKEQREPWEKGLEVVCEMNDQGHSDTLLVVLKDDNQQYHCHRYFRTIFSGPVKPAPEAERWEISADAQRVDADTAMAWLADPKAQPRMP